MIRRLAVLAAYAVVLSLSLGHRGEADTSIAMDSATFVRTLLDTPSVDRDLARTKLAIDKFVDPTIDVDASVAEIDRMTATVEKMIATLPPEAAASSLERMRALRAFLYEPGWWNESKPFLYDLADPYGKKFGTQELPIYLSTRKGNCVSMPILFLVLGDRIGLNVTLATAPLHVLVKWRDAESGHSWNLEATSGAGFTRDDWYRQKLPMTDEAVKNGVYLRALSRRETVALMATLVLEDLLLEERYEEAIAVADVLIEANPTDAYALVKKGTAYGRLLQRDILRPYPNQRDLPADKRAYAVELYRANQDAFAKAHTLGWREMQMN